MTENGMARWLREKYSNHKQEDFQRFNSYYHYYWLGYKESAEPRERRIAELEKQLTKAKELIEELSSSLSVVGECEEEECELLNRAEQFLKESE